jgi:hypothetical protein
MDICVRLEDDRTLFDRLLYLFILGKPFNRNKVSTRTKLFDACCFAFFWTILILTLGSILFIIAEMISDSTKNPLYKFLDLVVAFFQKNYSLQNTIIWLGSLLVFIWGKYWEADQKFGKKWKYASGLYNSMIFLQVDPKFGNNKTERNHAVRFIEANLAIDLIQTGLWSHKTFKKVFWDAINNAAENIEGICKFDDQCSKKCPLDHLCVSINADLKNLILNHTKNAHLPKLLESEACKILSLHLNLISERVRAN